MIYLIIAAVLGFAAWQLVQFVRRTKQARCSSGGCAGCGHNASCSASSIIKLEEL
ncbi:FeoB-associated Cys-rich membrane protein [Tumebacillus flagellatus]|uniref:FeoB-associated Cys-rich membrane protein n=1 Tax=Tumebacillus flagellatus TaxID=1157490 RepID=UPI0009E0257A|nr:FeoB-associated Cys-rich membrane protein [Tumebacillus flagellatus]